MLKEGTEMLPMSSTVISFFFGLKEVVDMTSGNLVQVEFTDKGCKLP
jgi:hypothetical protein